MGVRGGGIWAGLWVTMARGVAQFVAQAAEPARLTGVSTQIVKIQDISFRDRLNIKLGAISFRSFRDRLNIKLGAIKSVPENSLGRARSPSAPRRFRRNCPTYRDSFNLKSAIAD